MRRVHILVVVLVAGVAAIGCYWLWASRTPQVNTGKATDSARKNAQEKQEEGDVQQAEGPTELGPGQKDPQEKQPDNPNTDAPKIQTAQQAIEAAKGILGWENEGKYSAEKITIKNCFVPFVRKQVNGKVGWKVHLTGLRLKLKRNPSEEELPYEIELEAENRYVKQLECVVLAETGQLLYIESMIPEGVVVEPERIPVKERENTFSTEKIEGIPNEPSELSFREILNRAFEAKGSWVSEAKQIVAYYVVRSYGDIEPPQPLWIIYVRDFSPSMPLHGPGPPRSGEKEVDPGSINEMRLKFKPDGTAFGCSGGTNIRAPK